jgi:predicted metal-dependent phosphoesterase TrpH/energy-coupling factor transporter ATP-binding protein EcfA2
MVGLRWKKCDFHLHTTESQCYKADDTVESWVDAVQNAGLQCIAVTDHNSYKKIDEIIKASEKKKIIVFPGVEVTCDSSKVHILCIFDRNKDGDYVRDFLSKIDISGDQVGNPAGCLRKNVLDVCSIAKDNGAIVIAAHIDEYNGISEMSAAAQDEILDRKYIDAVQVVNKSIWDAYGLEKDTVKLLNRLSEKYGREISEEVTEKWRKAYKRAKDLNFPMIASSDNPSGLHKSEHGLWGIGKRYTWLKLEEHPTLESIRQAFLSSDTRVVLDEESENIPDRDPEYWIESVELNKSIVNPHTSITVEFNPQLNAIIGGRGSGKSTIVRLLTGALQSLDADKIKEIQDDQKNFYKSTKNGQGIFDKESKVSVTLLRAGIKYRISIDNIQSMDSQNISIEKCAGDDKWEPVNIDFLRLFKAQIFTQKQIFEIAKTPNALLGIIDSDLENASDLKKKIEASEHSVLEKKSIVRNLEKDIAEETKFRTNLVDVNDRIEVYKNSGISGILEQKSKFQLEKNELESYLGTSTNNATSLKTYLTNMQIPDYNNEKIEDSSLRKLLDEHKNSVEKVFNSIEQLRMQYAELNGQLQSSIECSQWKEDFSNNEKKYKEKCEELREKNINVDKLDELIQSRSEMQKKIDDIGDKKNKIVVARSDVKKAENNYINNINLLREERTRFLDSIIGKDSDVVIEIIPFGDGNDFVEQIHNIIGKKGSSFEDDLFSIVSQMKFDQGRNIEIELEAFRKRMRKIRSEGKDDQLSTYFTREIVNLTAEDFDKLVTFYPGDRLKVSYRSGDKGKLIPLSSASAGQKTTAILTFAMAYGENPLILDQPEDDLDNKLVYDLVVKRLKNAKRKRQIIVVTHNANIPVNGDSEYVIAMDSTSQDVRIKETGTIDDDNIRKEICDVMEGTQYAFRKRAEKYHLHIVE